MIYNIPDLTNALFELGGGLVQIFNILKLKKDKIVRGLYWPTVLFFSCWGVWNMFYYNHLQQSLSWYAGILLASTNGIWLIMMLYYIRKEKNEMGNR